MERGQTAVVNLGFQGPLVGGGILNFGSRVWGLGFRVDVGSTPPQSHIHSTALAAELKKKVYQSYKLLYQQAGHGLIPYFGLSRHNVPKAKHFSNATFFNWLYKEYIGAKALGPKPYASALSPRP